MLFHLLCVKKRWVYTLNDSSSCKPVNEVFYAYKVFYNNFLKNNYLNKKSLVDFLDTSNIDKKYSHCNNEFLGKNTLTVF